MIGTTFKTFPISPSIVANGPKTQTVVRNEEKTPTLTSLTPSIAAFMGDLPRERCEAMFSAITMPSSMSSPRAKSNPTKVSILIVRPICGSRKNAPSTEIGKLITTQNERRILKKSHKVKKTRTIPCSLFLTSILRRSITSVDASCVTSRSMCG